MKIRLILDQDMSTATINLAISNSQGDKKLSKIAGAQNS